MPSLVHMSDLMRIGEAAGRSLFPCLPQVDANASVWLRSPLGPCKGALPMRSHSGVSGYMSIDTIQHSAC